MQLLPFVHRVPSVVCNVYLLIDSDGLSLVDTGLPYSHDTILNYAADLGYGPQHIRRILITHADRDHVGSLAALQELTRARIYASAIEAEAIAHGKESRKLQPNRWEKMALEALSVLFVRPERAQVDDVMCEGDTLPIQGGLRVIETPGHTPGHLSFYAPNRGLLFVGDSFISLGRRLRISRGGNTWDEMTAIESAQKQAALGARYFLAGHGPALELSDGLFRPTNPVSDDGEE